MYCRLTTYTVIASRARRTCSSRFKESSWTSDVHRLSRSDPACQTLPGLSCAPEWACRFTTYRHRFARAAPAPRAKRGRASPVKDKLTGDARPRFFESLRFARHLRSRCGAREAMTVGCKPTMRQNPAMQYAPVFAQVVRQPDNPGHGQ